MNIEAKLQANLHPRDAQNMSLVTATNVKLSNDESCITNEENIVENTFIKNYLNGYYNPYNYKIVAIIPCNTELVLIVVSTNTPNNAQIFRYREPLGNQEEAIKCAYGDGANPNLAYHNGLIKGTFTYNVEGSLILAIAEYDGDEEKIPLRTVNLGNFDDDTIYNDVSIGNELLSVAPEVYIPRTTNLDFVTGNAYKGWYYLFIRYKINSVDYTQWFNFGLPIYVDSLETFAITKYCYEQQVNDFNSDGVWSIIRPPRANDGYCAGASDNFSSASDIANETFSIDIVFNKFTNKYKYFQIGIICSNKSYTKAFRTSDIAYTGTGNTDWIYTYKLNNASLIDASAEEFIIDNYNYFDVRNIVNYQNRLYISNYKENNANNDSIPDFLAQSYYRVVLQSKNCYGGNNRYSVALCADRNNRGAFYGNQYDSSGNYVHLSDYLNISEDTTISITGSGTRYYIPQSEDGTYFDAEGNPNAMQTETLNNSTINNISLSACEIFTKSVTFNIIYNFMWQVSYNNKIPDYSCIAYIKPLTDINAPQEIYKFTGEVTIRINTNLGLESINADDARIIYNGDFNAINGGVYYTNVKDSFNTRRKNFTLIPGEVYNFFIHYVDKYGHCTNGYKLENKVKWVISGENDEIIPIAFSTNAFSSDNSFETYYAAMPVDANLLTSANKLNTTGIRFFKNITTSIGSTVTNLSNEIFGDIANEFKEFFSSFEDEKYSDFKWYQIASGYNCNNFIPYYNNNGDRLFRIPIRENSASTVNGYTFYIADLPIPDGYIGAFVSYEKYEPIKRITGMLTRNDFRSQDAVVINANNVMGVPTNITNVLATANTNKSAYMYFYSGQYDISDSIRLDYNLMRIDGLNVWDIEDIPAWDYTQRTDDNKFCYDMNKPQTVDELNRAPSIFAVPNYKLCVADSAADDRVGYGTALQLRDAYGLFPAYDSTTEKNGGIKLYKATFYNMSRDIYMSNNKTLIRCSNIIYNINNAATISINYNDIQANGCMTYDGVIVYENAGLDFNTADNIARRRYNNTKYYENPTNRHTYNSNQPFLAYVQYYCTDDIFYESKSFKNAPTGYVFYVNQDTGNLDAANENNKFRAGCIVTPANSIDLFENRQDSADTFNIKTFTNYREDLVSIDIFDKTVRRSNVIQDESRENAWRQFPIEGYKNITENKGKITNLVGVGTMFLVHTEHSLFMFNTDNMLVNNSNQQVQLAQPDAFDVKYQEVFTSSLGYGGLQDDKAYVLDQFGYIFYNNDFHRFYQFDNGQLGLIDDDIIQWLDIYKPYNVRFANDKFNNRLLIKMNYKVGTTEKDAVISFNYNHKSFISFHDYYFDEAFNTKSNLYLKCNLLNDLDCSLHSFDRNNNNYGSFDNIKNSIGTPTTKPSSIGIVINSNYDTIKFLEYITYKLNKVANPADVDYTNSPIEGHITPYSGDLLRIYNNQINTGSLNILVDSEDAKNIFCNYEKPFWELGNWNFSYLRNNIANRANYGDAFNMSRLYGNYFVIEFTFNNTDNCKIEFEELKCNMTL